MDLHDRGGSPGEKGERVGDTVVPFSIQKIRGEEVRGHERSDCGGKEERNPSRDPFTEEEEGKEVHRGGKPRGVPETLLSVTADGH
jgi:hypothetical protein